MSPFGAAFLLLLISILPLSALRTPYAPPECFAAAAEANHLFTIELLQQLMAHSRNVFFSPFSISSGMALTSLGAKGKTRYEIYKALHFDMINGSSGNALHHVYQHVIETIIADRGAEVAIASAIFGQRNIAIVTEFRLEAKRFYRSGFHHLNTNKPEAQINEWTSEHTKDMIRDIMPGGSVTPDITMVLINAIYFKGKWLHPFNSEKTKPRDFFLNSKEKELVPTMCQLREFEFGFSASLKASILELPYEGSDLSMYILLPVKVDGVSHLVESLTAEKLMSSLKNLRSVKTDVKVPKFKLNLQLSMTKLLAKLGIRDLFSNPDLSAMAPNAPAIHEIRHGAAIDVSEEGTVAGAATATFLERSMPNEFIANHPFLFFIIHKPADMILFAGAVLKP